MIQVDVSPVFSEFSKSKENTSPPSSSFNQQQPPETPTTPKRNNGGGKGKRLKEGKNGGVGERTISAPTPENGRGSIRARVRFLQQRCVKVLGEDVYDRAHSFLKDAMERDLGDEVIERGLRGILGEKRGVTFGNLIDQIVFMEQC